MDRFEPKDSYVRAIERADKNSRRITSNPDWEMEDSGLSLWAATSTRSKARMAIEAYELGELYGLDSPACYTRVLVDSDGAVMSERRVTVQNRHAGYGTTTLWLLDDCYHDAFGRKWIPTGDRSRIQKKFGLHEEPRVTQAFGYDASCGGLGMPVTYFAVPDWDAELLSVKDG